MMEAIPNYSPEEGIYRAGNRPIIGKDPTMLALFRQLNLLADVPVDVLVTGETGTGKELVARALHYNGLRREGPFIAVNCAAIAESLLEAELFGHKKGAFTGASTENKGYFTAADKGTIFLDEIGDFPVGLQAKLLRVIQEREVMPVGGRETVPIDIRVIAATNKNLADEINEKRFRNDLFYRLSMFPLHVPTLKERGEDIFLIAKYLVESYNERFKLKVTGLTPAARDKLSLYEFGGNIRELENIIGKAVLMQQTGPINHENIMFEDNSMTITVRRQYSRRLGLRMLIEVTEETEADYIKLVLAHTNGVKIKAAGILGISRKNLWEKMVQHGIGEYGELLERGEEPQHEEERAPPSAPAPATPQEATWYSNGVLPILTTALAQKRFAKSRQTLDQLARSGIVYAEQFGTERKQDVVYLTPDTVQEFFYGTDPARSDYDAILKEIREGPFNALAKKPFAVFNVTTLNQNSGTIQGASQVKQRVTRSSTYVLDSGARLFFVVNQDNSGVFFPHYEDREERMAELQRDIQHRYERFCGWKPGMRYMTRTDQPALALLDGGKR